MTRERPELLPEMNLLEWYARTFGIGDQDVMEAPWVGDWVDRNHNRLGYDHRAYRWKWME